MIEFKDKVAVITGAGSGIGYALAERCAKEGMKVVLAEINQKRLKNAERKIKKMGAPVLAVLTDVSKPEDIETLAKKTFDTFGAVHLLFNNAGVTNPKYLWNYTIKDWQWNLGVNLYGVIYGVTIFLPRMLKQDFESLIVNTASMEGLIFGTGGGGAIYGVSKHGIVSLSETLKMELEQTGAKVKVAALCPGWIQTNIFHYNTNRPSEFQNEPDDEIQDDKVQDSITVFKSLLAEGHDPKSPEEAVNIIFKAIEEERFYILTHKTEELKSKIRARMEGILKEFDY